MTTATEPTRHVRTRQGYLLVLRQGDDVFKRLADLARTERIPSASLTGLGFGHATFGFWNASSMSFMPKVYCDVEIGSLVGSIAWKEGEPSPHLHAVACDSNFDAHGGHLSNSRSQLAQWRSPWSCTTSNCSGSWTTVPAPTCCSFPASLRLARPITRRDESEPAALGTIAPLNVPMGETLDSFDLEVQ